jgi:HlyD family secretion protein
MFDRLPRLCSFAVIVLAISCVTLWESGFLAAQEKSKPEEKAKSDEKAKAQKPAVPASKESPLKPATLKIKREPFKIEVSLRGIFESAAMTEVALRPQAWGVERMGTMVVQEAVEQGTAVHKGDTLVKLDFEKIDQAIRELEKERQLAEQTLHQAEAELPILEKAAPLDKAIAERQKKIADEDLKRFFETDRPFSEKLANFFVKTSKYYVEYAQEELNQLEKMYRSKDLREETEEIIVKRQRNEVERAEFFLKNAEIRRDHALKVELPRQEQTLKDNADKQTLLWDRARITTDIFVNQRRLALEKMRYDYDKTVDRLKKLNSDREMMAVKSPADGLVYYGKCTRGHWNTAGMVASQLHRGGVLMGEQVFMTIVQPRPMFIRATVEERELRDVRSRLAGKVTPTSFPDLKLAGKIEEISPIPISAGSFEAKITVDEGKEPKELVPGMACTAKFFPVSKPEALVVSSTSIFTDELDEDSHYVYLVGKDGKSKKHPITIGRAYRGKTEILDGLKEGDQILQSKPAEK